MSFLPAVLLAACAMCPRPDTAPPPVIGVHDYNATRIESACTEIGEILGGHPRCVGLPVISTLNPDDGLVYTLYDRDPAIGVDTILFLNTHFPHATGIIDRIENAPPGGRIV